MSRLWKPIFIIALVVQSLPVASAQEKSIKPGIISHGCQAVCSQLNRPIRAYAEMALSERGHLAGSGTLRATDP